MGVAHLLSGGSLSLDPVSEPNPDAWVGHTASEFGTLRLRSVGESDLAIGAGPNGLEFGPLCLGNDVKRLGVS